VPREALVAPFLNDKGHQVL
jgi:hypothetical protein